MGVRYYYARRQAEGEGCRTPYSLMSCGVPENAEPKRWLGPGRQNKTRTSTPRVAASCIISRKGLGPFGVGNSTERVMNDTTTHTRCLAVEMALHMAVNAAVPSMSGVMMLPS